jgi:hypothetical protein
MFKSMRGIKHYVSYKKHVSRIISGPPAPATLMVSRLITVKSDHLILRYENLVMKRGVL